MNQDSRHHSNFDFYFVVDLETSGSCPIRNGAIEFQMLVVNKDFEVINGFYKKVLPPQLNRHSWSMEAQKFHKFTYNECFYHTPNDQFCFELLCFLKPYLGFKNAFVCHASTNSWYRDGEFNWAWFDWNFLEWCFRKSFFQDGTDMRWTFWKIFNHENRISTVQLARDAGYKGNRLDQWAERLKFNLEHHSAMSDTYCCLEILKFFLKND